MAGFGDFRNDLWKFCRYRSWLFLVLILVPSLSLFSFKKYLLKNITNMLLYEDIISGDEMLSDAFPLCVYSP